VVITPPPEAAHEREARFEALCKQHGEFLCQMLSTRKDVLEESKKDLQQRVLLVLRAHLEAKQSSPEDVRAFLLGVLRNEIRNHKRKQRPTADAGVHAELATSPGLDPEQAFELTEQRARLDRYLDRLPDEEAKVIRHVILRGMTLDAAAKVLGQPTGTVATQLARARDKLKEQANDSDRQTALGLRRRGR
jgi:RNA polymerase sigma-70 factor (ECF subfamily)